jgi:hypothetical protein
MNSKTLYLSQFKEPHALHFPHLSNFLYSPLTETQIKAIFANVPSSQTTRRRMEERLVNKELESVWM